MEEKKEFPECAHKFAQVLTNLSMNILLSLLCDRKCMPACPNSYPECTAVRDWEDAGVWQFSCRGTERQKHQALCARVTLQLVVTKAIRTVPYPLLGENTLVLSDSMVLAKDEKGQLALMFR